MPPKAALKKLQLASKAPPTKDCPCWNCVEKSTKRDKKNHPVTRVLSLDMGTRSLGLCLVEFPPEQIKGMTSKQRELVRPEWAIREWAIVDFGINQARGATDELTVLFTGCGKFGWAQDLGPDTDVVVEAQPTNGPCKVLSHSFQTFFAINDNAKGWHGREFYFMAPNNKLKLDPSLLAECDSDSRADRKGIVMEITRWLLARDERNAEWRRVYSAAAWKQRTDLADALVQGMRYLQSELSLAIERVREERDQIPPDTPGGLWLVAQEAIDLQELRKKAPASDHVKGGFVRPKYTRVMDEDGDTSGSGRRKQQRTLAELL